MQLQQYLEETQTKVSAFAALIGVRPNTVHRWLRRGRTPDVSQMRSVYRATRGAVQPNDFVLL